MLGPVPLRLAGRGPMTTPIAATGNTATALSTHCHGNLHAHIHTCIRVRIPTWACKCTSCVHSHAHAPQHVCVHICKLTYIACLLACICDRGLRRPRCWPQSAAGGESPKPEVNGDQRAIDSKQQQQQQQQQQQHNQPATSNDTQKRATMSNKSNKQQGRSDKKHE